MAKPDDQDALKSIADSAQPVPTPHSPELRGTGSAARIPLIALDGRQVAVQIWIAGQEQVLVGHGKYAQDLEHGKILRIAVTGEAGLEIILSESAWQGIVAPGGPYGCDYLVCLNAELPLRQPANSPIVLE